MMDSVSVDVAIIGAGTAGMRAYKEVSQRTDSVVLIEGGAYGTTCARVGCMPSKLLIAAAEAAHKVRHSSLFGIDAGAPVIDGKKVMSRVREERDRFVQFAVDAVESWLHAHRVRARAHFVSDHELMLSDGGRVRAERIVIATGSRPAIPAMFERLGDRLLTSDDIFEMRDLPRSVAVFGLGVVGLELGQALHRLGVRVTLIGRSGRIGFLTDPEVAACARNVFANELAIYPDAEVEQLAASDGGVELRFSADGECHSDTVDYVIAATGRRPNVDGLGLENTSLELDKRGVPVHDAMSGQCGNTGIFVAGDATNTDPLLHEAADEGFAAGYNAAHFPQVRRFAQRTPIAIAFSDPQLMAAGETHAQLTQRQARFAAGRIDWADQGRARVMGVNRGCLRVYGQVDTGKFLGAEMAGPGAEHIAHLLAWARQSDLTVSQMLDRPFYHPVLEEGVRTALRLLNHALSMGPMPPPLCIDCGPGA